MARIALLPPPDPSVFVGGLPLATDPHGCRSFSWPVAVYQDAAGAMWTEWQCRVCGALLDQPASLEDLALAEPALPATEPTEVGDPSW